MANVLPVLMFNPEQVVLFATPEEKKSADYLEKLFSNKSIKVNRIDNLDAYDYHLFKQTVKNEIMKYEDRVILNVTGGTKLMALAAYESFIECSKPIIYCNTERNQIVHLYPVLKTEKLQLELSVLDYLHSYGYDIIETRTNSGKLEYYTLFEILERKNLLQKFSDFIDKFRSEYFLNQGSKTFNDRKEKLFSIQKTSSNFILFVDNKKFVYDNDKFLKGEWLEYYIFYFLKKIGVNPELGVKIVSSSNVENEIDLIFMKDYQLYLVSCKTGRNSEPNKDIYEIETLRNIAGGTYGKAFLITSNQLTPRIQQRAKDLNIRTLSLKDLSTQKFL